MKIDPFASYRLENLGGGHYHLKPTEPKDAGAGVRISFLPGDYIAIYGNYCPGREKQDNRGLISVAGYGSLWFRTDPLWGYLSPRYLAEKFGLERVFVPDRAVEFCQEQAEEYSGDEAGEWLELADDAGNLDMEDEEGIQSWIDRLRVLVVDESEAISSCYGYDGENLELLVDIQRAFARLVEVRNG